MDATTNEENVFSLAESQIITQSACDLAAAGNLDGARAVLEGLTTVDPEDASAWGAYGGVLQQLGQDAEAERAYREALKRDPAQSVSLSNLGQMLVARGDVGGFPLLEYAAKYGSGPAATRAKQLVRARPAGK